MNESKFNKIRFMILSRVLLVPFAIVMMVCGTLVYYFATNLRDDVAADLVHLADGHRRIIEQFLRERSYDLKFAAQFNSIDDLKDKDLLAGILSELQSRSAAFFDLGVFDEQGNHVAYIGPYNLVGKNYSQTQWFNAVREKGLYVSDVFLGYRDFPHFIIAVKKYSGGNTCYLRATIDTIFFTELVESLRIGKTGEAYLLNEAGVFQTRRRSGGALMEPDPDFHSYPKDETKIVYFPAAGYSGGKFLYAVGRLEITGWLVVVRQERNDAYAPLYRAVAIAVGFIVGGGAVVVVMAFFLASGLANRLTIADMEKKQMGGQLIMAGKLAEVGEMSAGVAHEINNPLQVMKSEFTLINDIMAEVESSENKVGGENLDMLKDSFKQIGIQIDRCKNITQGLLKFSRKTETTIEPIEVPGFMDDIVAMVEHRAALENISIVREYNAGIPPFSSDPNQLQQVFLNLLNNAIYALKGRDNGEIRIKLSMENGNLVASVGDNGCGIPAENLEKIFLPFYTTKPVGQGTGLGLSTCYGIVERLGGQISVASEPGVGTVFTIHLPIAGPKTNDLIYSREGGI